MCERSSHLHTIGYLNQSTEVLIGLILLIIVYLKKQISTIYNFVWQVVTYRL